MDDLEIANVEAQIDDTNTEVEGEEVTQETKTEDKRPSSVVKLLKQRNELKSRNAELEAKVTETEKLTKQMSELQELVAKQALETEAKQEKTEFFTKNPIAKQFESEIDKLSSEKELSYDDAFKLYAAINNPTLLLDEQGRNKMTSTTNLTGVTKEDTRDLENPTMEDFKSSAEFIARSNQKAKESRMASGMSN